MKSFYAVLVNTLIANVTTSFLWFALSFWVYLETKSVLATGIIGGAYMLLVAVCSIWFGTVVDHHKKKQVMVFASLFTLAAFTIGGILYAVLPSDLLLQLNQPWFWLMTTIVLIGAVVENMRNIALSTTVTLLVEKEKRPNANGLVGTVQGIGFIVTSVFSGLSVGLFGMGWTFAIAIVLTLIAAIHMLIISIPEKGVVQTGAKKIDIRGSIAAIKVVPGLFGLLLFSMFNNFMGGSYMALLDPYGLTLFSVEVWGLIFGIAGTGFIAGGLIIAKFGMGKNPVRTLLWAVVAMSVVGLMFTLREWWPLFVLGMWLYMVLVPFIEAAEQTIIQRVVPYERQGRVFGFAQALEASAAPLTAFLIAPIAEFFVIPFMKSREGQDAFGWLLGNGDARGIALIFVISGVVMITAALLAFTTKTYQRISAYYRAS